jgi:hypothetical protein
MSKLASALVLCAGLVLVLLGVAVLFSGGLALPTRHPPVQFHFKGLSLMLLALAPMAAGCTLIALVQRWLNRDSAATRVALGVSMAAAGLAFVLASKV